MVPVPAKSTDSTEQFQKGYGAVPIFPSEQSAALGLCIVVRTAAGPVGGFFIHLRDMLDTMVFLGCVTDAGGFAHEWVELWLQNPNAVSENIHHRWEGLSNGILDQRWSKRAETMAMVDRAGLIQVSSVPGHPLPTFFNISMTAPVNPQEKNASAPWELCTDDGMLEKHGLPPYSHSLARYLHVRGSESPFLPVTNGAPENEATVKVQTALGSLVSFNPWCGLMLARKFAPLSFEEHLGVLSGVPWKGIEHGEKIFKLTGVYRTLQDTEAVQSGDTHLFLGKRGRAGRLAEAFFLKLDLLAQAFRLVRDFVQAEQLPFLNLTADSFRVTLADTSPTLPFLWTAKVVLAIPGSAIPLAVSSSAARYFFSREMNTASIFRPQMASRMVEATGSLKIGRVTTHEGGAITLEGKLSTQEQIGATPDDLLYVGLMLSPGRVELHGHLRRPMLVASKHGVAAIAPDPADASSRTECNFLSFPQEFPESLHMALRSTEGLNFPNVSFGTLPAVSTPCDLYSLGVLGVRSLLVNDGNTLAAALEEFLILAQECADCDQGKGTLRERLHTTVAGNTRWLASLGPHRLLTAGQVSAEEAAEYLPLDLWWDAVATLMACFSGNSRDAHCAHLGDAPAQELEAVFQSSINDLSRLLAQTRSYLFIDAKSNLEINALVQQALRQHTGNVASQKG